MSDAFQIVRQFERDLSDYTGAPYVVSTTSCTTALLLACAWHRQFRAGWVEIPRRTYAGVAASVLNAGYSVRFRDEPWRGAYQLRPLPVIDCARRLTSGMYLPGQMQCLSFHWGKLLGLGQGGAILLDDQEADAWLRRARFDGRTEGVPAAQDDVQFPSWHAYMTPETAAHGIVKLALLPRHNEDLPNSDYPDLSLMKAFHDQRQ